MPEMSERDFIQGGMILGLIESWSDWVHRRVEYVTLSEPQVSERRVSVDFTLAPDPATEPVYRDDGYPAYLVPVAWIEKHRMTRFSLRDEARRALPVWTQFQTAVIGTTVLAEAATDVVQPPAELIQRTAAKLRFPRPPKIPHDVLCDLWFIASARPADAIQKWSRFAASPQNLDSSETEVSAVWRTAMLANTNFIDLATDFARNFLVVTPLTGEQGARRIIKMSFEERRKDTPITGGPDDGESPHTEVGVGKLCIVMRQFQRFLGIRAKRIVVPASSISRAECFHLEIDVPEGIRLTKATLRAYLPTNPTKVERIESPPASSDDYVDRVTRSTQCVHLHLARIPPKFTGASILALRIGDGLIVRGAWINALFTTAVLVLVAADEGTFVSDPAVAVAVLLGVPGGISLYLARSREPGMSTSMHAGVRLLALVNALSAFASVVVVLIAEKCKVDSKTAKEVCTTWGGANILLIIFAVVAGAALLSLSLAYWFSRRPPESNGSALVTPSSIQATAAR